jgi:hypothetical protein
VLGTAAIAAFSMAIAITLALGSFTPVVLVPTAVWFLFVLNLDRLLVASMAGHRSAATLVTRLVVAAMFGFVIAEPLVMRIFDTAIVQSIQDGRAKQLDDLRGTLIACNGEADVDLPAASRPARCQGFLLSFPRTPGSTARELAAARTQVADLQKVVDRDSTELRRLRDNAQRECGGGVGPGYTGTIGYGRQCLQRIADADEYGRLHPIAANTAKLTALRATVSGLEKQLAIAGADFTRERGKLVDDRVAEQRAHQREIGFLERMDALHGLTATSTALLVGSWAIRLFFVAIDCLPVVVKFFGGRSQYDELFVLRSDRGRRVYAERMRAEEARAAADGEIATLEAENEVRIRRTEADLRLQEHKAKMKVRLNRAVTELADELRRQSADRGA